MSQKIVIDIQKDGSIVAETFNIKGTKCLDELNKLLKDLTLSKQITKKDEIFDEKALINNQTNVKNND